VAIGGVPVEDISPDEFSAKVAYLPQAPHLVPGTVAENIQFFRPHVTRDDVVRAAKRAHLHEEIERFPEGYETVLDSHVDRLSGGQKQRLALARALATYPAILVLDEPTSALDPANTTLVMDTLLELRGSTTVIMITHNPSAIDYCDSEVLVEAGTLRREARLK
jgi:ABC-type bacteriocin/lantibiotic exporter with double-glycine peptidase domain